MYSLPVKNRHIYIRYHQPKSSYNFLPSLQLQDRLNQVAPGKLPGATKAFLTEQSNLQFSNVAVRRRDFAGGYHHDSRPDLGHALHAGAQYSQSAHAGPGYNH